MLRDTNRSVYAGTRDRPLRLRYRAISSHETVINLFKIGWSTVEIRAIFVTFANIINRVIWLVYFVHVWGSWNRSENEASDAQLCTAFRFDAAILKTYCNWLDQSHIVGIHSKNTSDARENAWETTSVFLPPCRILSGVYCSSFAQSESVWQTRLYSQSIRCNPLPRHR